MSHYKPYTAYKGSGAEWVGQVPAHWDVLPLRVVASVNDDERESTAADVEEIRYVDISTVSLEGGIGEPAVIASQEAPSRAQRKAKVGDVVLSTVRTYLRAIGQVKAHHEDCIFSTGFAVIRPGKKLMPDFLYAAILSEAFLAEIEANSKGVSYPAINAGEVMQFKLPVPPKAEQEIIASVLDKETTRIDALVEKKTRFIELLREKRQALITHAVTKGLDPNVKMKDSGVEWLGEVPEHWEVKPLKYIATPIIGLTYSPEDVVEEGHGTLVLRSSNIQGGRIVFDDNVYVSAPIPEQLRTRVGDIVICSRNGSRSLIGKNGMVEETSAGQSFGAFTTVVRSTLNEYLYFVLNSSLFVYQSSRFLTTTINQLTTETLKSFEVPLPPKEERERIVSRLKLETARIDTVIQKSELSIVLLKERRSALITAAVTGQIDLREAA